jgi:hypothetical protein
MKLNTLTFFAMIAVPVLLLQSGCQEQNKATKEPAAAPIRPVPAVQQEKIKTTPESNQTSPGITFEQVVYDFNEVSPGKKYNGRFKFTNTGNDLLKIIEVKKCCGVAADLENEKTEYSPGETGVLNVIYTSGRKAGIVKRQLRVTSSDKENPETTLTIKARVVPKIAFEPQKLEIPVKGKNAGCPEITLKSLDGRPFSIKAITSSHDCVTADVEPSEEATKFVIRPEINFEKLGFLSIGLVSISLTHPECESVTIPFSVLPEFDISPRSIIVLNAEPQGPMVKKVIVKSNYDEDFEIESVTSKNGNLKVLKQEKIDKGYILEIEVKQSGPEEKERYDDMLNVNIKGGEKLEIKSYIRYSKKAHPAQIQARLDNQNKD